MYLSTVNFWNSVPGSLLPKLPWKTFGRFLTRHGHSSKALKRPWFYITFQTLFALGFYFCLLFKCKRKEKNNSLCYTCFAMRVRMLLTTTTFNFQRRRWWQSLVPCVPMRMGVTGMAAGLGKLIKLSERHHVLKHGLERMLHFDVVLRDVHGNIYLCLDFCYVPFFF